MRALLVLVCCAGCIEPKLTLCGSTACSAAQVCSADQTCVSPDAIAACASSADGARCTFDTSIGFCHHGACVTELSVCGDGIAKLALDELCDCGTPDLLQAPPPGCTGFNSSDPGATCRPDCRPAHCGDGIVDPNELCDDGNTVSGDGCRADCQGRFEKMQTPTGEDLTAVAVLGNEAWAVGAGGTTLHFDGATWSVTGLSTPAHFNAVWVNAPDEIYVGGTTPAGGPFFMQYDGATWKVSATGAATALRAVWASSRSDVYVASGDAVLRHYDGVQWTVVATPCSGGMSPTAPTVLGTSSTNVYFGTAAGLCRYDGVSWTSIHSGPVGGLAIASPTGVVEVTINTVNQVWEWDGGSLLGLPATIPGTPSAIAQVSPGEVMVVGPSGLALSLENGTWTHLIVPTELALAGIAATSPTNVFVVGASGTVLH